jgi:hypothetical protein
MPWWVVSGLHAGGYHIAKVLQRTCNGKIGTIPDSGLTMTVFHLSRPSSQLKSASPSRPSGKMTSSQFRSWSANLTS